MWDWLHDPDSSGFCNQSCSQHGTWQCKVLTEPLGSKDALLLNILQQQHANVGSLIRIHDMNEGWSMDQTEVWPDSRKNLRPTQAALALAQP